MKKILKFFSPDTASGQIKLAGYCVVAAVALYVTVPFVKSFWDPFVPASKSVELWLPEGATLLNPIGLASFEDVQFSSPTIITVGTRESFESFAAKSDGVDVVVLRKSTAHDRPSGTVYTFDVIYACVVGDIHYRHPESYWLPAESWLEPGTLLVDAPEIAPGATVVWRMAPHESEILAIASVFWCAVALCSTLLACLIWCGIVVLAGDWLESRRPNPASA